MSDCPSSGTPVAADAVDGSWVCRPVCPTCRRTVLATRRDGGLVIRAHRDRRPDLPLTVTDRRRLTRGVR